MKSAWRTARTAGPRPNVFDLELRRDELEVAVMYAQDVEDDAARLSLLAFGRWAESVEAELAKLRSFTRIEER